MEGFDLANAHLSQIKDEIERKRRQKLRQEMRTDTNCIARYVVETCIEYRAELNQMESDNKRLKRDNDDLVAKNKVLVSSLEHITAQVTELTKNAVRCYVCRHEFNCDVAYLCCYCLEWVCNCCKKWCKSNCYSQASCKICSEKNDGSCFEHNLKLSPMRVAEMKKAYRKKKKLGWEVDDE